MNWSVSFSPPVLSGDHQSLVFCVVFCSPLFVLIVFVLFSLAIVLFVLSLIALKKWDFLERLNFGAVSTPCILGTVTARQNHLHITFSDLNEEYKEESIHQHSTWLTGISVL
jgi:hypothetical protein